MENIVFANENFLYLLILLVPITLWYIFLSDKSFATIQYPTLHLFPKAKTYKHYLRHSLFILRSIAFAALVLVFARPQSIDNWGDVTTKGIDIVIALDVSSSMLAEDLKPNRLEASKDVAIEFISGRKMDRMGLVVFSGESFTQCPLTTSHAELINLFRNIKSGMIEDGTAIGLGLANAVNRLKDSDAISKVAILLTDGVNNQGEIAPITAAEIAKTFGIRVYTIGVGTMGMAPYPFQTPYGIQYQKMEVKIDEEILKEISSITKGKYFRATDNKTLKEVYKEIDRLEKSKIEVKEYSNKKEEFLYFGLVALAAFFLEIMLRYIVFRRVP